MAEGARTGGCVCGAVRYSVAPGSAYKPYACHCRDCHSRSGSAFTVQMFVAKQGFAVEGDLVEGSNTLPSGAVARQFACARCLTRIYGAQDGQPIITLRAGTLDDSDSLVPAVHLWTASKLSWVIIPDDVPGFSAQPADMMEWIPLLRPDAQG